MRKQLTARQREIYDFIAQVIRNNGYPPTIREIMVAFGIASTNGVRTTLTALEKKGYIRRTAMLSRSIELTDYQDASLSGDVRDVPVIGRVAAGEPILATENIERTLAVDSGFVPRGNVFALKVEGDSMRDAGFSMAISCSHGNKNPRTRRDRGGCDRRRSHGQTLLSRRGTRQVDAGK